MAGHSSLRSYYSVFGALFGLTVLTVAVSFAHLAGPWHVAVALLIAMVKALLVALIFMHVKDSGRLIWLVAGAALFWLVIMMVLTFSDYFSRDWLGLPLTWPGSGGP